LSVRQAIRESLIVLRVALYAVFANV
jgi:hypothetical protein